MKNKILKSVIVAIAIFGFNGCYEESCDPSISPEEERLNIFVSDLQLYGNNKYVKSNKVCDDFKNRKISLVNTNNPFSQTINIEIVDKKIKIGKFITPLGLSKNELIDLLEQEALIKSNIDKYIETCK